MPRFILTDITFTVKALPHTLRTVPGEIEAVHQEYRYRIRKEMEKFFADNKIIDLDPESIKINVVFKEK